MDEVMKNMVTAQLKSAKTTDALHDAMVSAVFTAGGKVKVEGE